MRLLVLTLTSIAAVLTASELPKNLLRYSSGALPMVANQNNQWVTVNPESIDWNANYSAVLAGDIGKNLDLTNAASKTFMVDLGQAETINRISLYSQSATGSVTVYSSPIFENNNSANWSELGTASISANSAASINASAEARYLKFEFSNNSTGIISSMGTFGNLTYSQLRAPATLQPTNTVAVTYSLNYATPATNFSVVSTTPAYSAEQVMALFDDDPATTFAITQPTSIVVDFGADRQINSLIVASNANTNTTVQYANSLEELKNAQPESVSNASSAKVEGMNAFRSMGANVTTSARFAQINLNTPASMNGISFVGPVLPEALVFNRNDEGTPANVAAGRTDPTFPPVPPYVPKVISEGGNQTPTFPLEMK